MYTKKLVFKGKRRKIHIHQRAFKVFVGDPFAQYWCIDFGLLKHGCKNTAEAAPLGWSPPLEGGTSSCHEYSHA